MSVLQTDIDINAHHATFKRTIEAIIIVTIGWTAFVFVDAISKTLTQSYSVPLILTLSSITGVILSGGWILARHGLSGFLTPNWRWHAARSLCVVLTAICVVNALGRIPLADFYGIVFLSPMMLSLMSAVLLKEHIGWHRAIATVAGFGGVLILAGPQFGTYNSGIVFTFFAAFLVSINGIVVRKVGHENVMTLYAFYPFLLNAIVNGLIVMDDFEMPPVADLPLFAMIAILATVGTMGFSYGFSRAPETAVIAPFHYTQILLGTLLGYLLFGDIPTFTTILGAAIIIGAGIYLIWREHELHKGRINV